MSKNENSAGMKKTLSLSGLAMNAMALIAPGAFLWITFQVQAAQTDITGATTAPDMWFGLFIALILAFLTAGSYAMLARRYPDAGAGSSYNFADQALKERNSSKRTIRFTKFTIGWLSHLYYWVYPGVMVAFMAVLITFILQAFGFNISPLMQVGIAVAFAVFIGIVAYRGINTSTRINILLNIVQWGMIAGTTIMALMYLFLNPQGVTFLMPSSSDIIAPHNISHIFFQATIAILVLVGFESSTALMGEAKKPSNVSRAVIISLIVQGGAYLFEYFGAEAILNNNYTFNTAASSNAPIGDLINIMGNVFLGGNGFVLMMIVAGIVAAAILGTTLACLNTGVRVTYAISCDKEMPLPLGMLDSKHQSPQNGVIMLTAVSAGIGAFGVLSIENLTTISLLSNIGTFLLYGLTNIIAFIAFAKERGSYLLRRIVPLLGAAANVAMLFAVIWLGILGGGEAQAAAIIAIIITVVWIAIGLGYFLANSRTRPSRFLPYTGKVPCIYIESWLKCPQPWLMHVKAMTMDGKAIEGDYNKEDANMFIIDNATSPKLKSNEPPKSRSSPSNSIATQEGEDSSPIM
ncbi:MAG TPA: APC family permease [Candidatus Lokiarchaeia archaeon]|nr:APC family permease [Candidatus Lokiarchaeia archaeon]